MEATKIESWVKTLEEVQVYYSGKTIDNIIIQLKSKLKYYKNVLGKQN